LKRLKEDEMRKEIQLKLEIEMKEMFEKKFKLLEQELLLKDGHIKDLERSFREEKDEGQK
jgi:hypothetical protein